jgi:catechol-2,3-dioxygenase
MERGAEMIMAKGQRVSARVALLSGLVLAALLWSASWAHAEALVRAVGPIGMTVADMDRSLAFYTQVLGFEKVSS